MRHLGGSNPWLVGAIRQASVYNRPLTAKEVSQSYLASGMAISRAESLAELSDDERQMRDRFIEKVDSLHEERAKYAKPKVGYVGKRVQPAPTQVLGRGNVKSPLYPVCSRWALFGSQGGS